VEATEVPRKLAEIVSAYVAGYSRLTGEDEAGTLAAMKTYRRGLWMSETAEST
jgi:hypothetical protein